MERTLAGFAPFSPLEDERIAMEYPIGAVVEVEVFMHRSLPRMRLYWAVMHHVHANDPFGYASPEKISDAILIEAGVCSPERRLDGTIVMVPDSIAFKSMDEGAFRKYFDQMLLIVSRHWGFDIDAMLREGRRLMTRARKFNKSPKRRINPYEGNGDNYGTSEAAA